MVKQDQNMPQDTPREKHTYFMVTDHAARYEKKKKKRIKGMEIEEEEKEKAKEERRSGKMGRKKWR